MCTCNIHFAIVGDEVRITPLTQAVRIGGNVTISCRQQTGSVSFIWFFLSPNSTNAVLSQQTDGHLTYDANTLFITNVTADDFGAYSCERLNPPSCISDNRSILTLFGTFMCDQARVLYMDQVCGCVTCVVRVLSPGGCSLAPLYICTTVTSTSFITLWPGWI